MPTEAIEVLEINMYGWEQRKKDDDNGQLSCGINSSPATARLSLQRLGRRSLDNLLVYIRREAILLLLVHNIFYHIF